MIQEENLQVPLESLEEIKEHIQGGAKIGLQLFRWQIIQE